MSRRKLRWWLVMAVGGVLLGARPTPADLLADDTEVIRNVAYYEGPGSDATRHRLDMYLPRGHKDFPVLFFVHGGAWIKGDKNHFGIYNMLARVFTRHGIAVVCPNYRLSPAVQHPEHVRDVARAFAWTCRNIGKYGGNKAELFVGGHSAGGHLCALLATDDRYLNEHGLSVRDVCGAIPISGLFRIPEDKIFETAFGKDLRTRKLASPIQHVDGTEPAFLVILGDNDLPSCDRPQAEDFCRALQKKQVPSRLLEVPGRNHMSILLRAFNDTDPAAQAMLSFIIAQVTLARLERGGCDAVDALGQFIARYGSK